MLTESREGMPKGKQMNLTSCGAIFEKLRISADFFLFKGGIAICQSYPCSLHTKRDFDLLFKYLREL